MPPTLRLLLEQPTFHLRLLTGVEPDSGVLSEPLRWAHSSDLEDPTPWLTEGGLLLTDGTQFDITGEAAWADGYVGRLAECGVAALGFATQVVHAEVPQRLVQACERRNLALLEVADRAPFMAIIAFVNKTAASEQRERLEWSLSAQRAVARAALRPDGLNAVLQELERQLQCWVALFDAAGYRVLSATRLPIPSDVDAEVGEAVRAALDRGTRGGVRISTAGSDIQLQTLGRHAALQGVLAVGTRTRLDAAEHDLVTSVIALASIALDQSRTIENARHHLRAGLLQLVLSGSLDVAHETAEQLGWRLPPSPVRVCILATARPGRSLTAELEQYAERHSGRLFFADHRERTVTITREADLFDVRRILRRNRVAAGCSTPVEWSDLAVGLREARRAAGRSGSERPFVQFEELVSEGMLALLEASGGPAVARRILQPLQARPSTERLMLIESATTWLENNGAWDRAAKQLGVHRHTLRNRITTVEKVLALDLDRFGDRAELWAALQLDEPPAESAPSPG